MTTSGYCPARFGELPSLMPCAPWHMMHCWTAMVAPRPTASPAPERAISLVSTTLVEPLLAFGHVLVGLHSLGTPAARQILSHMPLAVKSPCTDGNQTKPTSKAATVSPERPRTLQRNQRLLHAYMPVSCVIVRRWEWPAPKSLSVRRAARLESRSSRA